MKYRRHIVGLAMAAALLLGLLAPPAHAQGGGLYFPATGHNLTNTYGLLGFWQSHGGERLLGLPITEALVAESGAVAQHFTRGRLERAAGSAQVATGRVGAEYAEALWKRFAPAPPRKLQAGERRFEASGHTLRAPFLSFWAAAGGLEVLGAPISEPLFELTPAGRRLVQYFERARLERDAHQAGTADEIVVSELGSALAALQNIDTAPAANLGFASAVPPAAQAPDVAPLGAAPTPQPPPQAAPAPPPRPAEARAFSGDKLIVVNLSDQWLYAYEGERQVFAAPVSTGRDGMETPTGRYAIYTKLKQQTMDGVTDGEYWVVPDVPNVMYFNGGVALHGTYWHNRFGSGARLSHGCVNLPLKAAAWLYAWAPVGTPVRVTY